MNSHKIQDAKNMDKLRLVIYIITFSAVAIGVIFLESLFAH
jgi:hypothetical protein